MPSGPVDRMEADWEFEVGGDAPVIDAYWPGLINLREEPERVGQIAETQALPELADVLLQLNQEESPVWTSKTEIFTPEQIDRDELTASLDEAQFTIACYIDLLRRNEQIWKLPSKAEKECRSLCAQLREIPLRCCRVDLVIRRAELSDGIDFGITAYLTACGGTLVDARKRLAECLAVFAQLWVSAP